MAQPLLWVTISGETVRIGPIKVIFIYNSVLTRRYRHTNSSASVPLNATKIAVMKVSGVGVVRVGPELLFWINKYNFKCGFLGICFARGRDAKRLGAELTLPQCGSVSDGLVGPEVAPPSGFHGHNVSKVCYLTEAAG